MTCELCNIDANEAKAEAVVDCLVAKSVDQIPGRMMDKV